MCFATLSTSHPWAYKNLVGLGVQVLFEKNPKVMVRCGWEPLVWNRWARRHQVATLNIGLLAIIWTISLWLKYPLVDMIHSFATAHLVSLCLGFSAISFSPPHSFPPDYPLLPNLGHLLHWIVGIFSEASLPLSLESQISEFLLSL